MANAVLVPDTLLLITLTRANLPVISPIAEEFSPKLNTATASPVAFPAASIVDTPNTGVEAPE